MMLIVLLKTDMYLILKDTVFIMWHLQKVVLVNTVNIVIFGSCDVDQFACTYFRSFNQVKYNLCPFAGSGFLSVVYLLIAYLS